VKVGGHCLKFEALNLYLPRSNEEKHETSSVKRRAIPTEIRSRHMKNKNLKIYGLRKFSGSKFIRFLCDLVIRIPGYRSRGPGFNSRR
jgi:hypothetical protein